MKITCDPAKRAETMKARGLDFLDAQIVFAGLELTVEDVRRDYGERRFQTVGHIAGRMVMVVWTPRGDARHVISMRKCNEKEQSRYQKRLAAGG
ncbi:MAG: BrnT family toxin [Reyranella sp.]|nr:BrnT family toxin [Reyranella sp.]